MSKIIKIKAKQNASLRTKNRVREHGPDFIILDTSNVAGFYKTNQMILIQSIKNDNYIGWFPDNELEIEEK